MRHPLPILYREFYDVPRMFVTERDGTTYLFDCPFDEAADDYGDCYSVYTLTDVNADDLAGSWLILPQRGVRLPFCIPVASVVFDPTKRLSVEADVLTGVRPAEVNA